MKETWTSGRYQVKGRRKRIAPKASAEAGNGHHSRRARKGDMRVLEKDYLFLPVLFSVFEGL